MSKIYLSYKSYFMNTVKYLGYGSTDESQLVILSKQHVSFKPEEGRIQSL